MEAGDATIPPVAPAELTGDTQREDITEALALMLGGLLLAGVSVGALILLMRNRRRSRAETAYEPTFAAEAPVRDREQAWSTSAARTATVPAYASASLPSAAAVALPRVAPTDPVERGELLKRMVAAEPDKANPFTSPKARLRRARLILQSLGREFESGKPRFDLSDYAANWPGINRNGRLATT